MALNFVAASSQCIFLTTANSQPASSAEIQKWPATFACWFNAATIGTPPATNTLMALDCTVVQTNNRWLMRLTGNVPSILTSTSGGFLATPSTGTVSTSTWTHLAMTITSATSRTIYLNGVATSDLVSTISFPIGQNNICIGADFNATTTAANFFNGSIAFPAIWNTALSQSDINTLYNSGSGNDPRIVEPDNLLTLMLFAPTNTYQDNINLNIWTPQGGPTQVADPFVVGVSPPVMDVPIPTLVTATTATLNGTIIFTRGATPTVEGFNYGTTTGYGTNVSNTGTFAPGAYSIGITGLTPSTIYHFRAFATNSAGTGVSIDGYFTTLGTGLPPGTPAPFFEKLGYSCNFDQQGASPNWNPPKVMPLIAASGAMWIRDTVNWSVFEPTEGVYALDGVKSVWMALIHTLGMKFCGLIQYPPRFYGNVSINPNENWPLIPCANFCAWLASTGLCDVIELVNEANNVTQFQGPPNNGSNANMDALVAMTVAARAAIRAAGYTTPVIGLDEQGSEVLYMASPNPLIDGVVYHPYDLNDSTPEHTYEPPYPDYVTWVWTVQWSTTIPIWETEFNGDNNTKLYGEHAMALWLARRYLLAWWLGIGHTFIYNFTDIPLQSLVDYNYNPRQQYWVTQRTLLALENVNTTGQYVTVTNATFDTTNIRSTVFCSSTSTVASVWVGNNNTGYAGGVFQPSGTATISFRCINTHVTDSVVDSMTGQYLPLSTYSPSLVGKVMTLTNYPISDTPQYITVTGASQSSPPLVATYIVLNIQMTFVQLTGGITFDGGAASTLTGFNYGPTTAYGSTVETAQVVDTGSFSQTVSSLQPGTTYHFQAFATNANGTGTSDDATFTTLVSPPPPPPSGGGQENPEELSTYDILLQSIIREDKEQIIENLDGGPNPLTNGAQQGNTVPEDMQYQYLKAFKQGDKKYRI
jgi:hypothetical protein